MNKILIVAAHPDDEILGCGGTVAKMIKSGYHAKTIILGTGISSRDNIADSEKEIKNLRERSVNANDVLGIDEVVFHDLPDNAFDTVKLLDIVKIVEKEIFEYRPDIIFTHYGEDLNIDHRITFQSVITACRPDVSGYNPDIYSFFVPSSTDWNEVSPLKSFTPNVFIEVSDTIKIKLDSLSMYDSEMRPYPHSRSIRSIEVFSQYWGNRVCRESCEPFVLIRTIREEL